MYGGPPPKTVYAARSDKIGHLGGAPIKAGRGNCRMKVRFETTPDGELVFSYGPKKCETKTKRRGLR